MCAKRNSVVVATAVAGKVSSRFRSHSIGWQSLLTLAHYLCIFSTLFAWFCICISAKLFVRSCLTVFRKLVPFSVINDFISSLLLLCPCSHTHTHLTIYMFIQCTFFLAILILSSSLIHPIHFSVN